MLLTASPVNAFDCHALQPLIVMHDAYRALISEEDAHPQAIAANQLLDYVPIYSARTFEKAFAQGALDLETARLEKVMVDAFFLARDILSGRVVQPAIADKHDRNATWLSDTIARTACFAEQTAVSSGSPKLQPKAAPKPQRQTKPFFQKKGLVENAPQALLSQFGLIVFVWICFLVYHSRHFRMKRVERLPRHRVAFNASATFDGKPCKIIVLDISLGGSKIECDLPLVEKEPVTLHLECRDVPALIVWATAFHAGVMFDDQLSEEHLQTILSDDGVTTRSKLSNIF